MLIVEIDQLQPGMVLAAPVLHPEHPETDLLKTGYVVEAEIIVRLRKMGVESVLVNYPGFDELDRHLLSSLSPERRRIYSHIRQTVTAAQKRTRPTVSYVDYYTAMRELVLTVMSQGEHPIYLEQISRRGGEAAVAHAAAVAHLALLVGVKLETYLVQQRKRLSPKHAREVVNLGVGAMLHDMGKLKLEARVQHHHALDEPQSADDQAAWRQHTNLGYQMIHNGVEASAAIGVLHHHQRFDGQGFPAAPRPQEQPRPLRETEIHVFARIIQAADLYDHLAAPDPGGQRLSSLAVLNRLRAAYGAWLDPAVLRGVEMVAPPFPPGSRLKLADGTEAVVIMPDGVDPYRPVVRPINLDGSPGGPLLRLREPDAPDILYCGGERVQGLMPPRCLPPAPADAVAAKPKAVAA